jgi:hypothetical protein
MLDVRGQSDDGKRPTVNDPFQDRLVDCDAELLGGMHACAIRDGLGKRESPCRCGSAADSGPPIRPCGQREAGRQLSRRNRPGVGEAPAVGKEVGEVRGPDGRWWRGWAGDHQWKRPIDRDAEWLRRRFTSAVLDLDSERAGLDRRGRAENDGGLDPIGGRHRQSGRKRARHKLPRVERGAPAFVRSNEGGIGGTHVSIRQRRRRDHKRCDGRCGCGRGRCGGRRRMMFAVVGKRRRWSRPMQCCHRGQCGHNEQEGCEPYSSSRNLVHMLPHLPRSATNT